MQMQCLSVPSVLVRNQSVLKNQLAQCSRLGNSGEFAAIKARAARTKCNSMLLPPALPHFRVQLENQSVKKKAAILIGFPMVRRQSIGVGPRHKKSCNSWVKLI